MLTLEQKQARNRAYQAKWAAAHPEERLARSRAQSAKWAADHPDKVRAKAHRRRVLLRGGIVENFTDLEIFERDGWVCQLCEIPINRDLAWPDPQSASLDHIVPITKGGHHTRANSQSAHLRCNQAKGNRV